MRPNWSLILERTKRRVKKRGEEKKKRRRRGRKEKGMELVKFCMESLVWFWVWIVMVFYGFLGS